MKKTLLFSMVALMFFAVSCGGGGADKVKLSEKGKMMTKTWKYDSNGTVSEATGDSTEVLKKDVKKIADFLTGTLRFVYNKKGELTFERKYGSGFLSTSTTGWWKFNADETGITMEDWDKKEGKRKPGVNYKIIELTADKLVLEEEGAGKHYYKVK